MKANSTLNSRFLTTLSTQLESAGLSGTLTLANVFAGLSIDNEDLDEVDDDDDDEYEDIE
jgi:hypothetical protein